MKEKEKADEMYKYAIELYGADKAKEESLKSAKAIYSLAPYKDGRMLTRSYWEKVIQHLEKK